MSERGPETKGERRARVASSCACEPGERRSSQRKSLTCMTQGAVALMAASSAGEILRLVRLEPRPEVMRALRCSFFFFIPIF